MRDEVTSYVGRQRESVEIRRLLGTAPLVTLTGPGGVGKTRLARRVASETGRAFADGVVFVELAELRDGVLVPNAVADQLSLQNRASRPVAQLVAEYLRDRRVLLVLDNCEHLVDDCAWFVHQVLAECPQVVVLATSRQSLRVTGEQVFPVSPLAVPEDDEERSDTALAQYSGVRLFMDRAVAVNPAFQLSSANATEVATLCRRLAGLPLALELAAARLRSLSVRQVSDRLPAELGLLNGGPRTAPRRQRTLRATIEWSYRLCSPAEQAVWARASVFVGSFDLDAAEAVCAGRDIESGAMLDLLDGLLDKSVLIRHDHGDLVRYRLLETLRKYGQERLHENGDEERVRRRHRDWFDQLTEKADREWVSPLQLSWVNRLRCEHPNLRAALDWSISRPGEAGVAMRMAGRLDEYWALRGSNTEVLTWLTRAVDAAPPDHPGRARALATCALCALWLTDVKRAGTYLDEAVELAAGSGDALLDPFIDWVRAMAALMRIDVACIDLAATAAAKFRALGDIRRELHPLHIHGVASAYVGDLDTARTVLARALALSESSGDSWYRSMALFGVAHVEVQFGDLDTAAEAAGRGLEADLEIDNRFGSAYNLEAHAWVASRRGEHELAATLFGAAASVWKSVDASPEVAVSMPHGQHMERARKALGDERFGAAFEVGRALGPEQARRFALGLPEPENPVTATETGPLTAREREIAELVAEGLTDRDIATRLVISPRTASTHVQHILTKLGVTNRTRIAAWIAGHRTD